MNQLALSLLTLQVPQIGVEAAVKSCLFVFPGTHEETARQVALILRHNIKGIKKVNRN